MRGIHCRAYTIWRWVWRTPSSNCYTGLILTWTKGAVHQVSLFFFYFSSTINTIHSLLLSDKWWGWMHTWWDGKQTPSHRKHHMGLRYLPSCLICTYLTSSITLSSVYFDRWQYQGGWEEEYRIMVEDFAMWCRSNYLQLNTYQTKETAVDFKWNKPRLQPGVNRGVDVKLILTYTYLGLQPDDMLDWSTLAFCTGRDIYTS